MDTIEGIGTNDVHGHVMNCKRWTCEHCMPIRCAQLRELAISGEPQRFVTLTASNEAGDDPDVVARALVRAWRNVLQRGRREGMWGKPQYLCVFEETKRHRPHLHILWRGPWIDQHWLSRRMAEYMASPVVSVERVTNRHRAARYISKYVSKAPWRWKGTKRYWRSQRWRLHETTWDEEAKAQKRYWVHLQVMMHNRCRQLQDAGWRIIKASEETYVAEPPSDQTHPPWPKPL